MYASAFDIYNVLAAESVDLVINVSVQGIPPRGLWLDISSTTSSYEGGSVNLNVCRNLVTIILVSIC